MRHLGRIPEFDERSRAYPIRALATALPLRTRIWDCSTYLDQGLEGACVGFSMSHEIAAAPVKGLVDNAYAQMVYHEAKKIDPWPGEDYDGTSVLAGVKTLQTLGWISEYRWAFSTEDVLGTLSNVGPVVLGMNWYEGMWEPDEDGYIHPTGDMVGGHAILALGYDLTKNAVRLHNSWGQNWGQNGRAWLKAEDLTRLLSEDGEACVPLVRTVPPGALVATRFKDVPTTHIHYNAIEWLAANGIAKGINPPLNDRFGPGLLLTRAQFATMLLRYHSLASQGKIKP